MCAAWALSLFMSGTPSAQSADQHSNQPAIIYWCPDRPADQQIAARPEPGCAPLVETPHKAAGTARQKALPLITIGQIQSETTRFLARYHDFLDCCADDVAELDRIEELQAEATNILQSVQASGIYHAGMVVRQFTLGEIVRQVAQSRRELTLLHTRLLRIAKGMVKLEGLGDEAAARQARELEADREGILKDFKPRRPVGSARTGVNIQDTTVPNRYGESPTGTSTLRSLTGDEVGRQSDLPTRPGEAIRDTTLADRYGASTEETTLRSSTGFAIGSSQNPGGRSTTPTRVGPELGDSTLNR